MIKPEEPNANDILAVKYGFKRMTINAPLTIDAVKSQLELVEILRPGEDQKYLNEEELKRRSRELSSHYGLRDAEHLLERPYKIPPKAKTSGTLILFPGTTLELSCYRAILAIYWDNLRQRYDWQTFWLVSAADSLSRCFFLKPSAGISSP
ncbi:MAG: hypothetical protein Q8R12_05150 [bacterium]|nr:hypothetical protein [bacterium]